MEGNNLDSIAFLLVQTRVQQSGPDGFYRGASPSG